MQRHYRAGLAAVALLALTAAQTPPPEPEDIIVEGERLTPAQARERAIAYVEHTGISHNKESVARFVDPVCPKVIGVAPDIAARVDAKVRAIATAAGARTGKAGCKPNLAVNFVGDGDRFMRTVSARDRRQLAKLSVAEQAAMFGSGAPIRWWYSTETRGRDGGRPTDLAPAGLIIEGMPNPALPADGGEGRALSQYGSSLVSTQVARALRTASVVVDTIKADGATLDAVAAYAALVALAEMKPRAQPLPGSILGLFGTTPPRDLTRMDSAFLRELYSLPLDRKSGLQRGRIVRALESTAARR
ncbi:hypothetical protein ACFOMD_12165 [Sphingoaurantiacus capsulatus]|uniref:DUF2927 domain-containing protein n=1 Tax=Sphingoaurantiacus capsulatus TaxID=1771310 RepID=A0ABV7XE67_9SPHN